MGTNELFDLLQRDTRGRERFRALNHALCRLIGDFNVVSFVPLDITDEESILATLGQVDFVMQYGEGEEPKDHMFRSAEENAEIAN